MNTSFWCLNTMKIKTVSAPLFKATVTPCRRWVIGNYSLILVKYLQLDFRM